MHEIGRSGKHIFWMGQLQTPVACYRKGGCTPEGIPVNPPPEWWGVGPNNSPQLNDRITRNGKTIWETLSKFPFPAPFLPGEAVSFFLGQLRPDLQQLAAGFDDLDPDAIRMWITVQMLNHYDDWTKMIEQAQERLASRRKKIALTKTIAVAVASFVVGLAAPVAFMALLSAIKTAQEAYQNAKQAREMAKALAEAEKAFAESDPEFAKEVQRVEDAMNKLAADAEARTAAQAAAQGGGPSQVPAKAPEGGGPSLTTSLAIGGGIAAIGMVALSLLKP